MAIGDGRLADSGQPLVGHHLGQHRMERADAGEVDPDLDDLHGYGRPRRCGRDDPGPAAALSTPRGERRTRGRLAVSAVGGQPGMTKNRGAVRLVLTAAILLAGAA